MDQEKLYRAYYMQVYSYTMTLAKDSHLAEEITQNSFYKALSAKAAYRREADVLTWLCAIAKNLFLDEIRRRKRKAPMPEEAELPANVDMEEEVADTDAADRIHLAVHHLEEPYKEVFQLRVFGELSFRQIAAIFGKTESWARVTYHRARLKIQERMEINEES